MKKCTICGEENRDVSKYCHMCGYKFVGNETEEEYIPPKVKRELLKKRKSLTIKKQNFKITKDMIFVFVIIILVVAFAIHYNSTPKKQDNTELIKALQNYEHIQRQQPKSSWDFRYKNDFAPSEEKTQIDLFE